MRLESPPGRERRPAEETGAAADTSHVNPPGGVTVSVPPGSDNLPSSVLVSLDNLPTTHALLVTTGLRTGGVRRHVYFNLPSAQRALERAARRGVPASVHLVRLAPVAEAVIA